MEEGERVNITVFNEAQEAYAAGDYERALAGFTVCTRSLDNLPDADIAKFYHLIGNCYIKSGSPAQAAEYYRRALEVAPAHRVPSLCVNLGTALLSSEDYEPAAEAFAQALEHEDYATPYKAHSGLGAAHMKLGNMTEAGAAYREAALDAANPAPAKALVNLGVCFMELDRAADAVVSYEAALDLGLPVATANTVYANLGQAHMAQGHFAEAVSAFEAALEDGTYELSALAQHDYRMAASFKERFGSAFVTLEGMGAAQADDVLAEGEVEVGTEDADEAAEAAAEPPLDPNATLAFAPLAVEDAADEPTQADVAADDECAVADDAADAADGDVAPGAAQDAAGADPSAAETVAFPVVASTAPAVEESQAATLPPELSASFAALDANGDNAIPSPENTAFFDISEEQINEDALQERRKARRHGGLGLKIAAVVAVLLVLLAAAACFAYAKGFGYPTQESVTRQFITAAANGHSTDAFWAESVLQESREAQIGALDGVVSAEVVAVERNISQSTVYVNATLEEGGQVYYEVVLGRDGISWVVEYVELYFPSEQ